MLPDIIAYAVHEETRHLSVEEKATWVKEIAATPLRSLVRLVPRPHLLYIYGTAKGLDMSQHIRCNACQLAQFLQLSVARRTPSPDNTLLLKSKTPDKAVQLMVLARDHPVPALTFLTSKQRLKMVRDPAEPLPPAAITNSARYEAIVSSPYFHEIERMLDANTDRVLRRYAKGKISPDPFVELLVNMTQETAEQFCEDFDVVLPCGAPAIAYVVANLHLYRAVDVTLVPKITDAVGEMARCSDVALIKAFGAFPSFRSRAELVSELAALRNTPGFFFPLYPSPSVSNAETTYLTPTSDPALYFIDSADAGTDSLVAYGTLERFRVYEVEELTAAFYRSEGVRGYRVPEAPHTVFPEAEITRLTVCLEMAGMGSALRDEIASIAAEKIAREISLGHEAMTRVLSCITGEERTAFLEVLDLLFSAAMYMRRWRGPGNPYPIEEKDTLVRIDPMPRVAEALTLCMPAFEKLAATCRPVAELRVYEYDHVSGFAASSRRLSSLLHLIANNEMCIRVASSRILRTVAFCSFALGAPRVDLPLESLANIS